MTSAGTSFFDIFIQGNSFCLRKAFYQVHTYLLKAMDYQVSLA